MNKKNKKSIKLKTMRYIKRVYIVLIILLLSISISSAAQSPYSGTPRSIPGTIQAEDFDKGGEGTAYHDLDSVNQGGQYRPTEGVDIESTSDTGVGYNVGWIQSGEWIEYTTNVSTTGTYTIQTRVASNGNGGTFHIEFNGIDKTGLMTIPNTGGWQNWQTLSKTVTLNSGQQVMKIVMDTNGATGNVGNLNYIRIASSTPPPIQSPYGGTPRSIPGTIQAEDFDKGGEGTAYHDPDSVNQGGQYRPTEGVDIESTTDAGVGYNVGWIQSGEWIEYTTNVSTTGTYTIQTRVASNGNGGTFHIEFNGIDKTGLMTIPNTGGWQNWQTLSKIVTLNSGQQVMKIVMDTNGATGNVGNLNYIRIASSTSAPTPTPTQSPVVSGAFYVATNGNDANPGTESQPWRTIQKAANTLKAGQTVYVKQGTYKEKVTVQNSGIADKWITFSSYPGQTATIDGTGISMGNPVDGGLFQIYGKSYIKVTGFKIINSGYAGFYVTKYGTTPSSNIIFSNNYLEKTWAAAIIMMGLASTPATNFIVDGNTLVQSHYSDDAAAHEGISIGGNLEGFEVKNNVIRDSLHGAIDAKDGARNGKIYRNTCTRTTYSCVYVDGYTGGASNIDIFENVAHDMKSQNVDDVGSGFNIASEQGGIVEKINIYNNLVYNNPGIALIIPWYSTGTVRDIKITSNTFYNNGIGYQYRGGIALDYDKATGVVVRNNILSQNNQYQISSKYTAIIENNFIDGFRGYSTETRGTNYIEGNPQFINPANPDFHLKSISPAIDKGSSIGIVNVDFDGKSRPSGSGYDIGAYEY